MLVATIYFAIMFISSPVSMAIAGWLYLGVSLITSGVFRISISYRIKQLNKATDGLIWTVCKDGERYNRRFHSRGTTVIPFFTYFVIPILKIDKKSLSSQSIYAY